jgi:HNH endonuclease
MKSPTTFNALLRDVGIDPNDVCLLRHKPTKPNQDGLTLFEFRERDPQGFETYLRTQERDRPIFNKSRYWANFVVTADGRTLFAGLYQVDGSEPEQPGGMSAFDGERAGARNGKHYALYNARHRAELSEQIDHLEIKWDKCYVNWCRKAAKKDFQITAYAPFRIANPAEEQSRVERQYETTKRLSRPGQGKFRADLIAIYGGKCAVTGCQSFDAIDAAHIHEVGNDGDDVLENGILLRADIHRLFDANLLAIDPASGAVTFGASCADDYSEFADKVIPLPEGGPTLSTFQARWKAFSNS